MEFDVSMVAQHKGSDFTLIPHIEGVVMKNSKSNSSENSNSNSTNNNELSATPVLFEYESLDQELFQLKEDLSIQQFMCPTKRVAASLMTETNLDWKMLVIFSVIFILVMFSVTALRTPQHESNRLKSLKMTTQDEINRVNELVIYDLDDTQQPHELARIKHHYEEQILKLRSQLMDGATSLVTMKKKCISLQKSLDVMVPNKDDSNYRIVSSKEQAEEQKIRSDELNELLKVETKDEMDRAVFLRQFEVLIKDDE